jgi:NADH-quinone oxidoreductase subunit N
MELFAAQFSWADLRVVAPELVLTVFALGILVVTAFTGGSTKKPLGYMGLVGVIVAILCLFLDPGRGTKAFSGMVTVDPFAFFFKLLFLIVAFLTVLASMDYTHREDIEFGEYYVLVLTATVGMILMASGLNLVVIFLGLEVMSISIYVLAGIMRGDQRAVEAAFKYFLLGAFASVFLVYGIALTYASTGSLDLGKINAVFAREAWIAGLPVAIMGLGLLVVGFGFKIALVPFHMWTPDVYEGAPTSITAFMATGVKAAGFAALIRVLLYALPALQGYWTELMWLLAVATMTVGNIIALAQPNIKRMLAYSSIAHAGYILVAFVAGDQLGTSSILFYLLAYVFMNMGAFTVLILFGKKGEENTHLDDYAGLGFKHPLLGAAMAIFMLSLAGIPPLAGFMAKFYIFSAAVKAKLYWLAVIGVLNSAVAAFYYLRVLIYMYFREPERDLGIVALSPAAVLVVIISVWGVLHMGILPSALLSLAQRSVHFLL